MAGRRCPGSLGDVLASRRSGLFVGRGSEVELFRAALDAEPAFSVLHLHGPGGIGKTTLLDVFADLALHAGAQVVRLDGRDVHAQSAVLAPLREFLETSNHRPRLVWLVDTYDQMSALDDWIRTEVLPRLPATTVTVMAGRLPPGQGWRADPAWRDLLRIMSLRNLRPAESRQYLQLCGVDVALHDRIVEVSHGHPLGLSLLADVVKRGGEPVTDPLAPDLVGTLLRHFADVVPSTLHRRALEVCALARVTTEALLRDALQLDDAHELFSWLRGLSFVEPGPDGLFPHELARDAFDADLRWRDPAAYQRVFRGVRAHIFARLATTRGREQQRAIFDQKFMFRHQPDIRQRLDWDSWGQDYPEPAGQSDRAAIVETVQRWEGPIAAQIAGLWFDRQPQAFWVVRRTDDRIRGVLAMVDLTAASAHDIATDPGAAAAWEFASRTAAARPGERVTQLRYLIDRDAYQGPSPTFNAAPILSIQHWLNTTNLAWYFLTLAGPDQWDDYFAFGDMPRAVGADFELAGQRYGLFAHDLRQVPVDAWQDLVTERALAREFATGPPTAGSAPVLILLSQAEFDAAVRQALRDLRRPDLLARNPLLRTRLIADRAGDGEPNAAVLDGVIREAAQSLREHPRDDKLFRAVDRTYLRPAATQERAAAALGLPFSTYRRHLSRGVARIQSWLWEWEIYGKAVSSTEQY